jgi:aminoglycoside phosphotransferase (APT) family kinase protein
MIPDELRQRLRRHFGVGSLQPLRPGMSGARVFHCQSEPPLVLRRWPTGTTTARVREVHRCWIELSRRCPLVPKLQSVGVAEATFAVDAGGGIWELMTWMPGRPLEPDAPLEAITAAAVAIGQVHEALTALGIWSRPAPAVSARLQRLTELDDALPSCFAADVRSRVPAELVEPVGRAAWVLQSAWPTLRVRLAGQLSPWSEKPVAVQYVLRDVHREHVLFDGGAVRGIIDFDALRVDTPATDLARWASGFDAFRRAPGPTLDAVLAGYFENRSFTLAGGDSRGSDSKGGDSRGGDSKGSDSKGGDSSGLSPWGSEFRTLLMAVAEASLWISLANWVVWLVHESRQFPDFQLVSDRIRRLTESVCETCFR